MKKYLPYIIGGSILYFLVKSSKSVNGINGYNELEELSNKRQSIYYIFEYKVSYGGKYYVSTNLNIKGQGIKKVADGSTHKRGLASYLITETALTKLKNQYGKSNLQYIESDY
jgi:hypothetical protein